MKYELGDYTKKRLLQLQVLCSAFNLLPFCKKKGV